MSKGKYNTCPVCGHLIDGADWGEANEMGEAILVPADCWVCGAQWLQRYVYIGDEKIEPGEEENQHW